jgi:hypothetical protein
VLKQVLEYRLHRINIESNQHKKSQQNSWLYNLFKKEFYFFFFTAFAFGKSVIEPSKISAAKPIDSFNVG